MPKIGDIARGIDIGKDAFGHHKLMWVACEACGHERWVALKGGQPVSRWCYPCGRRLGKPRGSGNREGHPRWKGGRHVTTGGYVQLVVPLNDPMLPMADERGRVYEHRLLMARHLNRILSSAEHVHHINGDKLDNRLENLQLTTLSDHSAAHHREIHELRARVKELERELREARLT